MDNKISELGEKWKSLPRNNADEIAAADKFYNEQIMPLSAVKFLLKYTNNKYKCDLMYVTVGTSWQPVALSIMAKKPERVIFLTTVGVKKDIFVALDFMQTHGYVQKNYDIVVVDKAESRELMSAVRDTYTQGKATNACFDITGGTKAMAAAAAMIAASLNMDIFYVESNYLPVYRHPEPGSERMVLLERPQDL